MTDLMEPDTIEHVDEREQLDVDLDAALPCIAYECESQAEWRVSYRVPRPIVGQCRGHVVLLCTMHYETVFLNNPEEGLFHCGCPALYIGRRSDSVQDAHRL